uniref:Ig-like domain-containing protein n=1 Tax=Esox lucius TaxID=8010 RepID=A0AAY5KX02_ESOLU
MHFQKQRTAMQCSSTMLWVSVPLTPFPFYAAWSILVLTCSASECAGDVTFTWQSLKDRPLYGRMEKNNTASQQIFDPVGMQHEGKVSCVATCADPKDKAQRSASVEVYAFPKDPIISGSELLTEGQDSDLTCTVPDVYPADRLKVQWLLGDKVLKDNKAVNPVVKGEAQTVTSVLKYKPTAQDHGQNVTCRATLDIKTEPETRETVASITVQCKYIMHLGPEPFTKMGFLNTQNYYYLATISVCPRLFQGSNKPNYSPRDVHISENIQVNIGESFTLTCQAKGHPEPTVLWRKLEKGGLSVMVGDGETLRVKETSWSHDGDYECMSHNTVGNLTAQVTVYCELSFITGDPIISGSELLTEGQDSDLTCTVPDVYPADHLKVQWLLGDKVLNDDKAVNPVVKGEAQTVTSVLKYKPTAQDHGQNVTCRATLDIKTEPETRETVASMNIRSKCSKNILCSGCILVVNERFANVLQHVEPHSPNGTLNLIDMGPVETGQYLLKLNNLGPEQTGQYFLNLTNVGPDQMGQYLLNLNNVGPDQMGQYLLNLNNLGPEQTGQYLLNLTNEVGHQSHHFSLSIQSKTAEKHSHKHSMYMCILCV